MKETPVPQPLPEPEKKPEVAEEVLIAMMNVLKCLMAGTVTQSTVMKADYAIRIFLSHFDKLDSVISDDKKNPQVISSYNFPCLMNLPFTMSMYGPLRDLWEGGPRGEGYLRFAKPNITQGIRKNWCVNLLRRLQCQQAFENVLLAEPSAAMGVALGEDALKARRTKFHKYDSGAEVHDKMAAVGQDRKNPLSVVILDDGVGSCSLFSVAGDYNSVVRVVQDETIPKLEKFGHWYHRFDAQESIINWSADIVPRLTKSKARLGYGILLPLLAPNIEEAEQHDQMYALVSSNWKSLDATTTMLDLID